MEQTICDYLRLKMYDNFVWVGDRKPLFYSVNDYRLTPHILK